MTYLTTRQAADYLQVSPRTLEGYRYREEGPRWAKAGRTVRYRVEDLDAWMAANSVSTG